MNRTSSANGLRTSDDFLDGALSDFFKSQMRQPWPAAPVWSGASEPSGLLASRTAAAQTTLEHPRNLSRTHGSSRDPVSKSRSTLAVSVVLLLGSCWLLTNSLHPTDRSHQSGSTPVKAFGVFKESTAENPAVLQELRKDKAEHGDERESAPKIKLP